MKQKWNGETDSGSEYHRLRRDFQLSHDEAVRQIENPTTGNTTPEQAQGLLFQRTKACRQCNSTDTRRSTMPESGELFPIGICNKCGHWWGEE